ncbi:uncharacterized protein PGTG_14143 [Puccinia graminis f. sp. tritici CRL 75-36-700-3]|uniref:FAD-binding PCMH-type domain-containing protein n=1 Tax=Puccinia graminis f. sp. tritici (strain CRL 75-36-700-3 / race SCCL) TaxID=418459 RepID=E3KX34_PUCGT|nr:uncharacterized protein PGTG_14143 [Puccinia graminis f. sp. tritici CRL 75-36-700-3]EFP88804.2 hypothetical protein PGTG_14143 [Puccinia graminis f. sp. tritici CRL 75-36-700-3]
MMMFSSISLFLFAYLGFHLALADTASLRQKFSALKIDAVFPGDPNYVKFATPFNKRFTYMPAAIVFPNNTNAGANSVKVGVGEKLPISPRAGGHSYAAYGLGGTNGALVIDLQRINQISVDGATGQATIGTGSRLGDIALGLNSQGGRALPHGVCPYVGLGGHASFGGYGFTSRQWGLTIDQIIGHEVVLANGSVVTTSKTGGQNADLFWALRGAGSSFGIMTSMKFSTQAAPSQATNYAYDWNFNEAELGDALIKLQTFCMSNLPAQFGMTVNLRKSSQSGKLMFSFTGAYYGAQSSFSGVVQPFLSQMPTPSGNSVKTSNWITSLQGLAGNQALSTSGVDLTQEHDTFYAKSITTPQSAPMSNSSIRAFSKYLANQGVQSNTVWFVQLELYGGKNSAVTAVGVDETAFAQRAILFTIQFYASSSNFAPPYPTAGFTLLDNMVDSIVNNNPSGWNYGAYANYVDDRLSAAQWKSLYYKNHYQRLTQIKRAYDPQNVFVYPQSITEPTQAQRFKRDMF